MSMLFDVWLVMHAMTSLIDDALASTELSGDDFGLYSLLRGYGPVTPTQISRWTGMRPTTVSQALKRLNARGHGEQASNPDDGRSYLIGLNAAGVAAHSTAAPLFLEAVDRLAVELGPDQREERLALQRIDSAFRAVLSLDDRPYDLSAELSSGGWNLTYRGEPLGPDQEDDVRRYIDFIRSNTSTSTSTS
jgi:DNA-binding MarR family transcriptional regulator